MFGRYQMFQKIFLVYIQSTAPFSRPCYTTARYVLCPADCYWGWTPSNDQSQPIAGPGGDEAEHIEIFSAKIHNFYLEDPVWCMEADWRVYTATIVYTTHEFALLARAAVKKNRRKINSLSVCAQCGLNANEGVLSFLKMGL